MVCGEKIDNNWGLLQLKGKRKFMKIFSVSVFVSEWFWLRALNSLLIERLALKLGNNLGPKSCKVIFLLCS